MMRMDSAGAVDIELRFDQFSLPEDVPDDFARELRDRLAAADLNAAVVVEPGSEERGDLLGVPIDVIVHLLTDHALDLGVGVASGALWDGIKATVRRLHPKRPPDAPARVLVQYGDGPAIEVDLTSDEHIADVVRALRN